jgi:hypothetical protein
MSKRDWRTNAVIVEGPLWIKEWFRSPLWDKDHCLGQDPDWQAEEIAWCGRALGAAREWSDEQYGGLWITNRKSAKCSECARRDKEWDERYGAIKA